MVVRCLAVVALACVGVAWWGAQDASAQAIIDNGLVRLGVNPDGDLITEVVPPLSGLGGAIGIMYIPSGGEATAHGCACEAWGVSYGKVAGYTRGASAAPGSGVTVLSFSSTASTAVSRTKVGQLTVTHDYHPSPLSMNLYNVDVTLRNDGASTVPDVRYRRAMDWDVSPTPYSEYVTIDGLKPFPPAWIFSSDNGFASGNPLEPAGSLDITGPPGQPPFFEDGPADHGAVFDFAFGALGPGETIEFTTYYGAAGDKASAKAAVAAVAAQAWTFGQPSSPGGAGKGSPNTFIWAFGNLAPPVPPIPEPPIAILLAYPTGNACTDRDASVQALASDLDGSVVHYTLDLGDGTIRSGAWSGPVLLRHAYQERGQYLVRLDVVDDDGLDATATVSIQVGETDCCPSFFQQDRIVVQEGELVLATLRAFDPDGDPAGFWLQSPTQGATFDPDTGRLAWQTEEGDAGMHRFLVGFALPGGARSPCPGMQVIQVMVLAPRTLTADSDSDGVPDHADNCPADPNHDQVDADNDGQGDACGGQASCAADACGPGASTLRHREAADGDGDGQPDAFDNCPAEPNASQADLDADRFGDSCDMDIDGDGLANVQDACPAGDCLKPARPLPRNEGSTQALAAPGLDAGIAYGGLTALVVAAGVAFLFLRNAKKES